MNRAEFQFAVKCHQEGKLHDAELGYRKVLAAEPDNAHAMNLLGVALNQMGRSAESVSWLRRSVEVAPDSSGSWGNLGMVLAAGRDWMSAKSALERSISIEPGTASAHNNLGNVLMELGDLDAAEVRFRTAIDLEPGYAEAFNNLGNVYVARQHGAEAVASYERALAIRPNYPEARLALASTLLLMGEFSRGWVEYEARWPAAGRVPDRGLRQPAWDGGELAGKTILLHAEQGLGDTLQFVRYVRLVRAKGAGKVIILCPPELVRLLSGQSGVDEATSDEGRLPPFDVHCPLLSAPRVVGTTIGTIPNEAPYITADASRQRDWATRLGLLSRAFDVGIVWAGSSSHANDRNRSMRLADLQSLSMEGVRLFSLQKGDSATQTRAPIPGMSLVDWTADLGDLADTAAFVANLDLVISVDTAVAHLAGAMGKPVWVLLPQAPDWRWMWGREDSPWYPTMRLYRQQTRGEWAEVVGRVAKELESHVRDGSGDSGRR